MARILGYLKWTFFVLMPCRALEVFGLKRRGAGLCPVCGVLMPCRALEVFGRNSLAITNDERAVGYSLNALSGIGGVRTDRGATWVRMGDNVLMPCRALEVFGRLNRRYGQSLPKGD